MKHHAQRLLQLAVLGLVVLAAACHSTGDSEAPEGAGTGDPVKSDLSHQEKRNRAEAILETILAGLDERNHALYLTHFTSEWQEKITAVTFERMAEAIANDLGRYRSREYMGRMDKDILDIFMWKGKFEKTGDEDALIRLVLGEVDGRYQVFSFSIAPY